MYTVSHTVIYMKVTYIFENKCFVTGKRFSSNLYFIIFNLLYFSMTLQIIYVCILCISNMCGCVKNVLPVIFVFGKDF